MIKKVHEHLAKSIEDGYFIANMMPSLQCSQNCPHCYIPKQQRRSSTEMPVPLMEKFITGIVDFYEKRNIHSPTVIFYWYGGEPTEMDPVITTEYLDIIDREFARLSSPIVKHFLLSSLVTMKPEWLPIARRMNDEMILTSFDGEMRGNRYVQTWLEKIKWLQGEGFKIGTISVLNSFMLAQRPKEFLEYLVSLDIETASFLPFLKNGGNEGRTFDRLAPRMEEYSDFMIELTRAIEERSRMGLRSPTIGQFNLIQDRIDSTEWTNLPTAAATLYPEGQIGAVDYVDGDKEVPIHFGSLKENTFEEILFSKTRQRFLLKQRMFNSNPECQSCNHNDKCLMEYWKKNNDGDDCYGARKFVDYLVRSDHITRMEKSANFHC